MNVVVQGAIMKSFFFLLIPFLLLSLSGCSPKYDYTVHKPKIKYKKPSRDALARTLKEKLGSDYEWAEEGPHAFDCSGLTYYSYGRMNMEIPRTAAQQAKIGKIVSRDELKYGDLLFFNTSKYKSNKITHVGIYISGNKFEHASTSDKGVIISDLNNRYYSSRLITCRRYLTDDYSRYSPIRTHKAKQPRQDSYYLAQPIQPIDTQNIKIQNIKSNSYFKFTQKEHYIQVGSFLATPSSQLLDLITNNGYSYKIINKSGSKKILIGPYRSKAKALRNLEDIRTTIKPDAFEVSI